MRFFQRMMLAGCVIAATMTMAVAQDRPQVYAPGNGVSLPVPVTKVNPDYTADAKRAHIEGTVALESVVLQEGTVGAVSVIRSLDSTFGLDRQAVSAMKLWRFQPGMKDGKPVAVRVQIEMNFTLK
ncbi:MAG: energy transducer TonB [Acidobacteriota bacterium]